MRDFLTEAGVLASALIALDDPRYWSVSRGGIQLAASSLCMPGDNEYRVVVWTICGGEQATVDLAVRNPEAAGSLARRVRILSSVEHYQRNACDGCEREFRAQLSPAEKLWLKGTWPEAGRILGTEVSDDLSEKSRLERWDEGERGVKIPDTLRR